jgi:hypothetical protein
MTEAMRDLFFAAVIACSDLGPMEDSKYMITQIINLQQYMVFRRWDWDGDGHADVMTGHKILTDDMGTLIEEAKKGILENVKVRPEPVFYWLDVTGRDAWDRIYVDIYGTGRCELYASQDRTS